MGATVERDLVTADHFELSAANKAHIHENLEKIEKIVGVDPKIRFVITVDRHRDLSDRQNLFAARFNVRFHGREFVSHHVDHDFKFAVNQARMHLVRQLVIWRREHKRPRERIRDI